MAAANQQLILDQTSMFATTPVYQVNGSVVFGLRTTVIPPDDQTDRVIVTETRHAGRIDLLAYELYGDPALWWVIAEANQMVDPITETTSGLELRVPLKSRVMTILST